MKGEIITRCWEFKHPCLHPLGAQQRQRKVSQKAGTITSMNWSTIHSPLRQSKIQQCPTTCTIFCELQLHNRRINRFARCDFARLRCDDVCLLEVGKSALRCNSSCLERLGGFWDGYGWKRRWGQVLTFEVP